MGTLLTVLAAIVLAGGAATGVALTAADDPADVKPPAVVQNTDPGAATDLDSSTLSYDAGQ